MLATSRSVEAADVFLPYKWAGISSNDLSFVQLDPIKTTILLATYFRLLDLNTLSTLLRSPWLLKVGIIHQIGWIPM